MENGKSDNDIFRKMIMRIPQNGRAAFIACFICGMLTHIYAITNKITNWDDIICYDYCGQAAGVGRWFLPYVFKISSIYSVPAAHGITAVLMFAAAAALIVMALDIKTVTGAVLSGIMLITFPSVASMMTFMFTVHCYAAAVVMAALAAFLTVKYGRPGRIAAIVLLVLSMATYQIFYLVTAAVLVMELILSVFRSDGSRGIRYYIMRGLRYLEVLILSIVIYVATVRFGPYELSDYRGVSSMGKIDIGHMPVVIMRCYHRLLQFFITDPPAYAGDFFRVVNIALTVFGAVLSLYLIFSNIRKNGKWITVLTLVLLPLLALCVSGIYILAPETQDASTIMIYPYALLYIYVIAAAECISFNRGHAVQTAAIAVSYLLVLSAAYSGYLITNGAYYRSKLAFDRIDAFYNRIMVKVEAQNGYTYDQKLLIDGDYWPEPNILSACDLDGDAYKEMEGVAIENGLFTSSTRYNFIRLYLGIQGQEVSEEEQKAVEASGTFKEMPSYPADGCVRKINDIWVVKINDIR